MLELKLILYICDSELIICLIEGLSETMYLEPKRPIFHRDYREIAPCLKVSYFCIRHVGGSHVSLGESISNNVLGLGRPWF